MKQADVLSPMLFNSGLEHAMRNWKQSLKSHGLHVGAGKIDVKELLWSHQKWNASRPSLPGEQPKIAHKPRTYEKRYSPVSGGHKLLDL